MTISGGGVNPAPSFKPGGDELIVEPDETQLYGRGKLQSFQVEDLVNNPVALQLVFNDITTAKRELKLARQEIRALDFQRGQMALQPSMLWLFTALNVAGAVLIGIGVNLAMKTDTSSAGWIVTVLGGLVSVLSGAAPFILTYLRNRPAKSNQNHNNARQTG